MVVQDQWIMPDNGADTLIKRSNTTPPLQQNRENNNPDKAMAEAHRISDIQQQNSPTMTPTGGANAKPATTTVSPDGTVVVKSPSGTEEDSNAKFAVGKALEKGWTTTPTPPAFNPEIDSTVFGKWAAERNTQDNTFLQQRNEAISNSLGTKLWWDKIQNMSDSDLKRAIVQDLIQKGAPMNDPGITNTVFDIQNKIRKGQSTPWTNTSGVSSTPTSDTTATWAAKTSNDYFQQLTQGIPIQTNNAAAQQANFRYSTYTAYSNMTTDQVSSSIQNGKLIPGDQTWTDLTNAGMTDKLKSAQQLSISSQSNRGIANVYNVLNTNADQSLSTQNNVAPPQPDIFTALMTYAASGMNTSFATLYQQMVVNDPTISKYRNDVIAQQGKVSTIENQLTFLQNDLKNQIISRWGEVTDGYLASLLAERSQPLERDLASANIQLWVSTNMLNMNMQLASQTLQFAQQDFQNKQASLGLITQLATTQQAQQIQKASLQQVQWPNQYTAGYVRDPITKTFKPLNNQGNGFANNSTNQGGIQRFNVGQGTSVRSMPNPYYGTWKASGVWLNDNNPWSLKTQWTAWKSEKWFAMYNTPEEGRNALLHDVEAKKANTTANYTIGSWAERYAPLDAWNNPASYAATVAKNLWVDVNTSISQIPTQQLAAMISKHEDPDFYNQYVKPMMQWGGQYQWGYDLSNKTQQIVNSYWYTPDVSNVVEAVINGTQDPSVLDNIPGMQRLFPQIAIKIDPGYNNNRFANIQAQFVNPSGKDAGLIDSVNTMFSHVQALTDIQKDLWNTNYPWLNKKIQDLTKSGLTNDPKLQALLSEAQTLNNYINGENAAVNEPWHITDRWIADAKSLLDNAKTPAQLLGAINGIAKIAEWKMNTAVGDYRAIVNNNDIALPQNLFVKNPAIIQPNSWLSRDSKKWFTYTPISKAGVVWALMTIKPGKWRLSK